MGISLKDIASAAGVSEATASLALNGRKGVNAQTRDKVIAIAKEMGYVGSDNAKTLASRRSGLIGVMVPNISNLFYSNLVRHIERALRDMGYKMILVTTESNINYEKERSKTARRLLDHDHGHGTGFLRWQQRSEPLRRHMECCQHQLFRR